jgi:hypothetical protein
MPKSRASGSHPQGCHACDFNAWLELMHKSETGRSCRATLSAIPVTEAHRVAKVTEKLLLDRRPLSIKAISARSPRVWPWCSRRWQECNPRLRSASFLCLGRSCRATTQEFWPRAYGPIISRGMPGTAANVKRLKKCRQSYWQKQGAREAKFQQILLNLQQKDAPMFDRLSSSAGSSARLPLTSRCGKICEKRCPGARTKCLLRLHFYLARS